MGNQKTKEVLLKANELNEFHNMSSLSTEILIKLHEHYRRFSAIKTDDGVIDYLEFCTLINKKNTNLTKKIFNSIDANKDSYINFREFVKFLSCFDSGTLEDQINLSFNILCDEQSKLITSDSIISLLKNSICDENTFKKYFTDDIIDKIVGETFKRLIGDSKGDIDSQTYNKMVRENPEILAWFKIDLEKIKKAKLWPQKNKKNLACFG